MKPKQIKLIRKALKGTLDIKREALHEANEMVERNGFILVPRTAQLAQDLTREVAELEQALEALNTLRPKLSTYTFVTGNRVEVEAYTEEEAFAKVYAGDTLDKGEGATILEYVN